MKSETILVNIDGLETTILKSKFKYFQEVKGATMVVCFDKKSKNKKK